MKRLSLELMILAGGVSVVLSYVLASFNWRRAVHLAFVIALVEGAIRKWFLPQASELVYFGKDIVLLGAYLKFYLSPEADVRAWVLRVPLQLLAAVCFIVMVTGAINPNIGSPVLALYGAKIYLWYVPLAFMMPYLFRSEEEMTRQLFWYCMLAIPICLLGVAQFVAGPSSPLNVYAQSQFAEMNQVSTFGAGSQKARITGTFSYITGHCTFVIAFFGLSLALLTGIADKRKWLLLLGTMPLLAANALMSGSRGAVYSMIIFTFVFVVMSSMTRMSQRKDGGGTGAVAYLLAAVAVVAVVANLFFGEAINEFQGRRKTAEDTVSERVLHPLWSVTQAAKDVGMTGYGIGMSHPALEGMRTQLKLPRPAKRCPVYDSEMGQVLAELGWPGFLMWYFLRLYAILMTWNAFWRARPSVLKTVYLTCFCFQAIHLSAGVILNHFANLYVFATWGLCMIPNLQRLVNTRKGQTENRLVPQGGVNRM